MLGLSKRFRTETWQRRRSLALAAPDGPARAPAPAPGSTTWSEHDLLWERDQEQAAAAFLAGDPVLPPRLWGHAFHIAERHFGRGDPRLACSLTNQALVHRRQGDIHRAQLLFDWALETWDHSWRWLAMMTPARPDQGVAIYGAEAQATFRQLIARGRAATAALERREELPANGFEPWQTLRPRQLCDLRKLLAAVLLMAPRPH